MASSLRTQVGVSGTLAKSYAYDEPAYFQADPQAFVIPPVQSTAWNGGTATNTTAPFALYSPFTNQQWKSITIVPTVAPTANDQLSVTLTTLGQGSLVFGTATTVNYLPSGMNAVTGTVTATASNIVTLSGKVGGLAAGQTFPLGTCPAFNPLYVAVAGGTYDVVVANAAGTNTQTNFVFPSGPSGGLLLSAGDVLKIAKGTDTIGAYNINLELYFTPGSNLTM